MESFSGRLTLLYSLIDDNKEVTLFCEDKFVGEILWQAAVEFSASVLCLMIRNIRHVSVQQQASKRKARISSQQTMHCHYQSTYQSTSIAQTTNLITTNNSLPIIQPINIDSAKLKSHTTNNASSLLIISNNSSSRMSMQILHAVLLFWHLIQRE